MMLTIARLKKKMMCGTSRNVNATVKMVLVVVIAHVVVTSRRWRHAMMRPSSPR